MDDLEKLIEDIEWIQDPNWDGSCNRKECYWNLYHPNSIFSDSESCVSESLADIVMTPNSKECKGYWDYEVACGCKKGE